MTVEQATMAAEATDESLDAPSSPEPAESNLAPPEGTADTADTEQQQSDEQQDAHPANKEAAKYRRRLRETEAELSSVRGQLEAAQRQVAEWHAAKILRKPEALWAADVPLADLVDESGTVVPERVETAARQAVERLGLERTGIPRADMSQGAHGEPAGITRLEEAFTPHK